MLTNNLDDIRDANDVNDIGNFIIPDNVQVFEITGPLFFGAAYKFKDAMRIIEKPPKVLIIRMRKVPIIDATGIRTLAEVYKETKHRKTKLILSEVHYGQVRKELQNARLLFAIGKANITESFPEALNKAQAILSIVSMK